MKCNHCKEYTQSIGPIIIKKERGNRFHIRAICIICNKQKNKYLNKAQVDILPPELKDAEDYKTFVDNIDTKSGGIIPILPVIAAIAAGITALSTAGGVAANTIISAKNLSESERHNKELENIARGGGFEDDKTELMSLLQAINKNIKKLSLEKSAPMIDENAKKSHGHSGFDPNGPSPRTRKDTVILPSYTPTSDDRTMSDDELTERSVAYLTGKGFQIQRCK